MRRPCVRTPAKTPEMAMCGHTRCAQTVDEARASSTEHFSSAASAKSASTARANARRLTTSFTSPSVVAISTVSSAASRWTSGVIWESTSKSLRTRRSRTVRTGILCCHLQSRSKAQGGRSSTCVCGTKVLIDRRVLCRQRETYTMRTREAGAIDARLAVRCLSPSRRVR